MPKAAYKRSYFVDWVAANRHKLALHERIDWIVDGQRPDEITFAAARALRRGLAEMATPVSSACAPGSSRGRGAASGSASMPQLAQDVPNYAWSFELIVPENGLLFESDGWLLEVSFDFLMHRNPADIIGESASAFGYEFPIRFDFLDTFDGGNLSVQCHPRPAYIRRTSAKLFTQDETYYILDCRAGRAAIWASRKISTRRFPRGAGTTASSDATPVDVERFVQVHPAQKHDLIPDSQRHDSLLRHRQSGAGDQRHALHLYLQDVRLDAAGLGRQARARSTSTAPSRISTSTARAATCSGEFISKPLRAGAAALAGS
jgi:hypothetical protein